MRFMGKALVAAVAITVGMPAFAVTDKEMEQAKTIAAQAYLRYANDGSGYLDDVKATTMSELEGKLKAKEKENIKSFKSVKVPSNYASWDKAKLVEFWSVTFFTSPELIEKGKAARSRVKARVSSMTVAEPSAQVAEEPKPEPVEEVQAPAPAPEAVEEIPTAESAIEKQEEILADQNAIAKDEKERGAKKESGNTVWYLVLLGVLIVCVVWLVSFAAKVMKKQAAQIADAGSGEGQGKSFAEREELISALKESERTNSALAAENDALKAENKRLQSQLKAMQAQVSVSRTSVEKTVSPKPKAEESKRYPNEIYLGRANAQGLFVRADRKPVAGATVYRLETRDGLVGTYHVVDSDEVVDLVVSDPAKYLAGGCTGSDLDDTDGVMSIVTLNSGTALFENGCWKVLRKSRIRYER